MLFVLSTGRAGSRSIANVLSQHPELVCTHEPLPRLIEETWAYRRGLLSAAELGAMLAESRPSSLDGRRYCESANRLSLAVPVLAETFPDAQFLWLMRDGRDVVSSGMQRGWFDADVVKDTPWERHRMRGDLLGEVDDDEWEAWTPFRRVSWLWRRTNEMIGTDLDALDDSRSMQIRLEDLPERMDDVADFLDVARMQWVVPRLNARSATPDTGANTANQVERRFGFADWSEVQRAEFEAECGSLMDDWYPDWRTATPPADDVDPATMTLSTDVQVDLASLRVLRGELNLLTSHSLRIEGRNAALRTTNERLEEKLEARTEKIEGLHERLHRWERRVVAATDRAAELQRQLDDATSRAEAAEARADKAERASAKARKHLALVESSESYRLGHRIVLTFRLPQRALRALRRRLGRTSGSGTKQPAAGKKKAPKTAAGEVVSVEPDERPGFADLDRLDPDSIASGALQVFRLTLPQIGDPSARVERALATLAEGGTGEIVVPSSTDPATLRTALATLEESGWAVDVPSTSGGLTLEVRAATGESGTLSEAALLRAAASAEQLEAARAENTRLSKTVEKERKVHAARLEKARDSTQYRLGDALLGVVRNPAKAVTLPRELLDLHRRRSRPDPAPSAKTKTWDPALDLKVVSVLDEFTHDCFAPEFDLVSLDRSAWRTQLEGAGLLFVESAWRGNGGTWNYTLNQFDKHGDDMRELVDAARTAGIPTLFWNKEDPVSFDVFLPAAGTFDAVLTTDRNVVDDYKSALGHDRVDALAFAAQPRLHNPIGRARGSDVPSRVCFAGSWRGDKYAQRGSDFDVLLGPPLERGALDIFDRYAGGPNADTLGFPPPFRSAVLGSLPYSEMGKAYRRYAGFLNVNSVQDSPTMFSRRVFELLACGTPVISSPALGIEEMLGDTVLVTDSREKTAEYIDWVINEPEARDRFSHRGYRLVHREHSYERRVDAMLGHVGVNPSRPRRRVSVICVSNRPAMLDHAVDSYLRQTYVDTEFIFVANSGAFDDAMLASVESRVPGARVLRIDESATLGDCLNEALTIAEGEYFAKFDDDDHYGDEYLADLMMTFPYSGAAVAGKQCYYAYLEAQDRTVLRFPGREYRDAPRVVGGTIVADRSQVGDIAFEAVPRGTDSRFLNAVRARGLSVFSADRYNFCQVRHADVTSHTWNIDEEEFLKACIEVGPGFTGDEIFV